MPERRLPRKALNLVIDARPNSVARSGQVRVRSLGSWDAHVNDDDSFPPGASCQMTHAAEAAVGLVLIVGMHL